MRSTTAGRQQRPATAPPEMPLASSTGMVVAEPVTKTTASEFAAV
jgi:hypothetical protein